MKNSHITNVRSNQSKIITDKDQIVEEFACYYEKLYKQVASEDKRAIQAYLKKIDLPKVTQENNVKLTKVVTLQDVKKQIQVLKRGKSPGDAEFTN